MPNWSEPLKGQGSAHDFNVDPTLIAVFDRSERIDVEDRFNGGMREQTIHRFHYLDDGAPVDVWGSADLDGKLRTVQSGVLCRIVFLGLEELDGDRKIKRFSVQVDEEGPAAAQVAAAAKSDDDIPF